MNAVTEPEPNDEQAEPSAPASGPSSMNTGGLKQVTLTEEPLEGDDARTSSAGPAPNDGADPYIGKTVDGRYFVETQLGEGGMGVVYRCRHTIIDKKVAMKVLRADMARNEEVTERFLNEARSASSIGNPHIIDISDFGRLPDGATYFIMEFLTGTSLADLVGPREPVSPPRAAHIILQLTEGLAAAHDAGIVHRDLKPDNIFLVKRGSRDDFVKILDFGIAKASTNDTRLTQAGQVFGTPHYMSPEQASGSPVDLRSDVYAVGVILYELCTGQLPFDADNFMAILTQHMYKSPLPPSLIDGLVLPPGLEAVILRCLAKEPGERYQTMTELGEDIERVFSGTLPVASRDMRGMTDSYGSPEEYFERRSGLGSMPPPPNKPNLLLYASVGALAALAAGTAVYLATRSSPPPTVEPEPSAAPAVRSSATKTEETDAQPAAKTTQVAIAVAPLSAHVFNGDEDLGQSPVMVQVGEEPLSLIARLEGYEDYAIEIDGTRPKVTVELEKVKKKTIASPVPRSRPVAAPTPKPKPLGDSELVNPWD